MDTTPPFQFGYHTDTCGETFHAVSSPSGAALCDTSSVYMTYAPYGLWDLTVLGTADLSAVTAVRFFFDVRQHYLESGRITRVWHIQVLAPLHRNPCATFC
jgi:hypothetical protein